MWNSVIASSGNKKSRLVVTRLCLLTAGSLTQAIRNFAKSLEGWLKTAMQGIPEEMIKAKVGHETHMEHIGGGGGNNVVAHFTSVVHF